MILTGLATSLALRINLYNLGAEGQLLAGALATLAVGTGVIVAPSFVMIPLVVIVAAAAGGALMLLAALIRLRRGGDEAIVTLLLNVVMLLALPMVLTGPLDIATATVRSQPLIEQASLSGLGNVAACSRPPAGARGRRSGLRDAAVHGLGISTSAPWRAISAAARAAGIRVARMMVRVGLISGALAGIAGAFEVSGSGYLTQDIAGPGFAGIAVAVLAGRSPLAIVPAALLVAVLLVGVGSMQADRRIEVARRFRRCADASWWR